MLAVPQAEPDEPLLFAFGYLIENALFKGEPLKHLRPVTGQHGHDRVDLVGHVEHDVRDHRARLGEQVRHVSHHRITAKRRRGAVHVGHRDQVAGVLDQLACRPVIGMIIVRAVCEHEIGPEVADFADHATPGGQVGYQLAVGDLPRDVFRPDHLARSSCLLAANIGQLVRPPFMVPRLPVGQRDDPDLMSQSAIDGGQPTGVVLGIIRMRPEHEQL